jgi:MFS family permease
MPIVARDLLGGGAPTFGLLLGGFGVGAMLGALSSALLRVRLSSESLLCMLSMLSGVAMLVIGQSRWAAVTIIAHVLAGSAWTLGLANFNISVQMLSPRWVTGRMLATYQTIAFAGIAVGSWIWGELASRYGVRESLSLAGLMVLATLLAARWLPMSTTHQGSLDPQTTTVVRPPKVEIHPSSGPIVVTIEYRVPSRNAVAFAALINALGRIRRRDGARNWSVSQDVDAPELWLERFESPTWMDYLRRQTRPTLADQAIREQVVGLIEGENGTVRRLIERPSGAEPIGGSPVRPEPLDDSAGHA